MVNKIKIACSVFLVLTLFASFQAVNLLWRGYHDVDGAYNMANLGLSHDKTTIGVVMTRDEIHLMGMSKIWNGIYWFCSAVILAFISGCLFRKI